MTLLRSNVRFKRDFNHAVRDTRPKQYYAMVETWQTAPMRTHDSLSHVTPIDTADVTVQSIHPEMADDLTGLSGGASIAFRYDA